MDNINSKIQSLSDLVKFRSAPKLDKIQEARFSKELSAFIDKSDWFTIGIMAESKSLAISILREIEHHFQWTEMKIVSEPNQDGPVFLKANQKTGEVYIRIEYGLGEGILLGCHHDIDGKDIDMLGPLPLDFFKQKD